MDRRENLKMLLTGSITTGFLFSFGCNPDGSVTSGESSVAGLYGRTAEEMAKDKKLFEDTFFTPKEKEMVALLSDIIIPADEISGSATEAGVPDFIEFMMKDYPAFQLPVRGGLMWLENQSLADYETPFINLSKEQQLALVDKIAWPDKASDDMKYGVNFFNLLRNLTCTGFFTSQMGIKDIGYAGNRPNQWDGVPEEVLDKFGLSYDEKYMNRYLKIEDQQKLAQWDDTGNLL